MSDDKDVEIDPRFDPAFQRGFDQSIPIEEYVPAAPQRDRSATGAIPAQAPAPSRVDPLPATAVVAPAPTARPAERVEADAAADVHADADAESAVDAVPEADSSPSRNPFLLSLIVIAIALVAVGVWLFVRSGAAFNSRDVRSQGDYMSLDATIHMAPFIALLGAATAIGVLFVFAAKWTRRRP